jgi:ribosomal protein S1
MKTDRILPTFDLHRQVEFPAWEEAKRRHDVGDVVAGVVVSYEPYGMFVDLGEPVPGFVDPIEIPDDAPDVGETLRFRILQFSDWNRQIRLSLNLDVVTN